VEIQPETSVLSAGFNLCVLLRPFVAINTSMPAVTRFRFALVPIFAALSVASISRAADAVLLADFVIRHAKVLTVDPAFSIAEAIAVRGDKIVAVGTDAAINRFIGAETRVIDAYGKLILPGLQDSHVHSFRAATSEMDGPVFVAKSIPHLQSYLREQAAKRPPGSWIVIERGFPTRLAEGRLPTKAELDEAAPNNPVHYNAGPVSVANSKALAVSNITRDTPDPLPGQIVKDPKTGEPTGLLRFAAQLLKVAASAHVPTREETRAAVKHMYHLMNQQGITSVGERSAEPDDIDFMRDLAKAGELTVRINCTRVTTSGRSPADSLKKIEALEQAPPGKLAYGPTGFGDDWVRIGPLKVFLDGGMLIGSAYMREPWGVGPTYQITDPAYRGILNQDPEQLKELYLAAAKRGWQVTAHCAGEAAMDTLLDCYEYVNHHVEINQRRFLITHGNFQSEQNLKRCREMGVCADLQPAWLYKDGASLLKTLGDRRMKWFLPFKTWMDNGLIIGGGSDHMIKLDSLESINPWNPWLGIWESLTRQTELGGVINPAERLNREQAIRFYTINNAYLHFDEPKKGSLEVGKYADLILVDRDLLTCPVDDVRGTKVLMTMVGGGIVWDATKP
jgi:predicted amidohydrolase YtcJ